jgi:hypothetical protein
MTPPRARASAIMVSSCLNDWNWSDSWHFHLRGLLSLGYKFRQNSGRNFSSVPDSVFLSGMLWLRFRRSDIFHWWLSHIGRLVQPSPHCEPSLIPLERAYQSLLSLCTSKRSWYQGSFSWTAFKLKKIQPKPRPLHRNFGSRSRFRPNSVLARPDYLLVV